MIVKNEQDWIEGAVQSVRSIVDEVIIVDTGSTDATVARARALGARVIQTEWNASFAEARNVSLAAAREPWILVLDADERISTRDLSYIQRAIQQGGADGHHLTQRNYVFNSRVFGWTANAGGYEEGKPYEGYVDNPLIRLFRNSPEIRFHGAVHEIVNPTRLPAHFKFGSLPVVIHHYGKVRSEEHVRSKQHLYLKLGMKKVEEDPSNAKAYLDLGIQYQELAQHAEARKCFEQGFKLSSEPTMLLYWAISEKNLAQYSLAAALLHQALALGLDTFEIHLELGNVFLASRRWHDARSEYEKCLLLKPDNPIAVFNYALALRNLDDLEGAENHFNRALKLDPQFREPKVELAVLRLQENRPDDALQVLEALSEPDARVLSLIGAAHLQKDNLDQAQRHLEAALRKDRSLADARLNLAQIYARKGDYARASRHAQSVSTK